MGVGVKFGLFRPQRRGERLKASVISHIDAVTLRALLRLECPGEDVYGSGFSPLRTQGAIFWMSHFRLKHSRTCLSLPVRRT